MAAGWPAKTCPAGAACRSFASRAKVLAVCGLGCLRFAGRRIVGGHPDLPAGGHEEDPMAITERDRIRRSTHRHAALPNTSGVATMLADACPQIHGRQGQGAVRYRRLRQ